MVDASSNHARRDSSGSYTDVSYTKLPWQFDQGDKTWDTSGGSALVQTDTSYVYVDICGNGYEIITTAIMTDTSFVIHTTFQSYDASGVVDIRESLTENVTIYDDDDDVSGQNTAIVNQIKWYASQIQCESFHGKGTIDDYAQLFQAASNIANETSQMQLNVDMDGFHDFATAADDLSRLFQGFIVKLQSVNIINDTDFLTAIAHALERIVHLSKTFGLFKETILQTTTIKIPKSTYDTQTVLKGVMDEINCAMDHIQYFVDPSSCPSTLTDAQLNQEEHDIIDQATNTIQHWNTICNHGISIAMNNDPSIQYIAQVDSDLSNKAHTLQQATANLKIKLANYISNYSV
jgi:hypothetical protein